MVRQISCLFILISALAVSAAAQIKAPQQIVAANGQTYKIAGTDRQRGDNEIVYYTLEYYKKNPTFKNGADVYVAGGKVAVIQDRAGAVYIEKKSDPGAVAVGKEGYVLSAAGDARKWLLANVKTGDAVRVEEIKEARNAAGEIAPAATLPCFPGAYYRKVASSFDVWTGIIGVVKLGTPTIDNNRIDPANNQPLDNFSVYMGGRAADQEIDAGLTWAFTKDEQGNLSKTRNAWRPFWRNETWSNAPNEKQFTWYPGDTVQMAVLIAGPGKLRLVIADASPQPKKVFQIEFDAAKFAPNVARQFKRVNAIDQFKNEGKPAQTTKANVIGAEWLQTLLLRGAGAEAKQLPMDQTRMTDMRCGSDGRIVVTTTDAAKGAEKIDIFGWK